MPAPGKKGRRHTRTRRPYERRRRTRRAPKFTERSHNQHGGQGEGGDAALVAWLRTAESAHMTPATPATQFVSLQKQELTLTTGTGPTLPNYHPEYLGDIVTNIAVGIGAEIGLGDQRIDSVLSFITVATELKTKDPELFSLLGELENDLRQLYSTRVKGESRVSNFVPDMLLTQTPVKTPFLMIAYANLPTGVSLEPRAPVLGDVKDLPSKTAASPPPPQPQPQPQPQAQAQPQVA